MYPVGQSRREGSIHRQQPGGTRIASAHGPCQGATRLLQDLPGEDCLLRWALHKTHLDVWEWMHLTRLFKGQRSPILGELLRGGQLGGREFAGQRVAERLCQSGSARQMTRYGQGHPHVRSHLVFHHATASGIRVSEPLLCLCVPLFGREAVPLRRHLVVLRDSPPPVLIRASHVPLSIR